MDTVGAARRVGVVAYGSEGRAAYADLVKGTPTTTRYEKKEQRFTAYLVQETTTSQAVVVVVLLEDELPMTETLAHAQTFLDTDARCGVLEYVLLDSKHVMVPSSSRYQPKRVFHTFFEWSRFVYADLPRWAQAAPVPPNEQHTLHFRRRFEFLFDDCATPFEELSPRTRERYQHVGLLLDDVFTSIGMEEAMKVWLDSRRHMVSPTDVQVCRLIVWNVEFRLFVLHRLQRVYVCPNAKDLEAHTKALSLMLDQPQLCGMRSMADYDRQQYDYVREHVFQRIRSMKRIGMLDRDAGQPVYRMLEDPGQQLKAALGDRVPCATESEPQLFVEEFRGTPFARVPERALRSLRNSLQLADKYKAFQTKQQQQQPPNPKPAARVEEVPPPPPSPPQKMPRLEPIAAEMPELEEIPDPDPESEPEAKRPRHHHHGTAAVVVAKLDLTASPPPAAAAATNGSESPPRPSAQLRPTGFVTPPPTPPPVPKAPRKPPPQPRVVSPTLMKKARRALFTDKPRRSLRIAAQRK